MINTLFKILELADKIISLAERVSDLNNQPMKDPNTIPSDFTRLNDIKNNKLKELDDK